jgi:hypothetical protein
MPCPRNFTEDWYGCLINKTEEASRYYGYDMLSAFSTGSLVTTKASFQEQNPREERKRHLLVRVQGILKPSREGYADHFTVTIWYLMR